MGKEWTRKEEQYLIENWGMVSISTIAKKLGRSENAVIVRKDRLGLGAFLESGDYVTWNQLQHTIGCKGGSSYKMKSWVANRGFPIHTKRVNNNSFKIVYLDEWWIWAEKNRDLLDFSKFEENSLGLEPDWVKEKRKHDFEDRRRYNAALEAITDPKKKEKFIEEWQDGHSSLNDIGTYAHQLAKKLEGDGYENKR